MEKKSIEAMEHSSEIWINEGHLQKKHDTANIADRTQYCSSDLKK